MAVVFPEPLGPSNPKISALPDIQFQMIQCGKITVPFYQIFYVNHTLVHMFSSFSQSVKRDFSVLSQKFIFLL